MSNYNNTYVYNCTCDSIEHLVQIRFWPEDEDETIIVEVFLEHRFGFWKRLYHALRWVVKAEGNKNMNICSSALDYKEALRLGKDIVSILKDKPV